jgi:hypothetical protein
MTHVVVVVNNQFRGREKELNDDEKRKKMYQNERELMESYYSIKTSIYNGTHP